MTVERYYRKLESAIVESEETREEPDGIVGDLWGFVFGEGIAFGSVGVLGSGCRTTLSRSLAHPNFMSVSTHTSYKY